MQAHGEFAQNNYHRFLNKVAQRSADFLESQDPEPRTRRAPLDRPEVAAYGTGDSRMKDIFGTGGENTHLHQALMATIHNQPKCKRREPRRPLTGNLASIVASAEDKSARKWCRDSGSDEERDGEVSEDEEECVAFSNKSVSKPGKHGSPFLESKVKRCATLPTTTPGAATSTASATFITTTSPLPTPKKNPSRLPPHLRVSCPSRVPTNPKSSKH